MSAPLSYHNGGAVLSHMAVESLTYAEIGERLGVSVHAARALVKRLRLPRIAQQRSQGHRSDRFLGNQAPAAAYRGCHEWLGLDFRLGA